MQSISRLWPLPQGLHLAHAVVSLGRLGGGFPARPQNHPLALRYRSKAAGHGQRAAGRGRNGKWKNSFLWFCSIHNFSNTLLIVAILFPSQMFRGRPQNEMRLEMSMWLELGFVCTVSIFELQTLLTIFRRVWSLYGMCFVYNSNCHWLFGKDALVHYNCPGAKGQRCIYRYTVEKVELQATWQKFKWCKRPYWSYCITAYWCYWYHHSSSPSVINLQDLSSLAWAVATARAKDSAAVALLRQALIGRVKASHSCCLKEYSQGDLVCLLRLDVYSLPR